jgi:hypothetical protein
VDAVMMANDDECMASAYSYHELASMTADLIRKTIHEEASAASARVRVPLVALPLRLGCRVPRARVPDAVDPRGPKGMK